MDVRFPALDGYDLAGSVFAPEGAPRGTVVISSAMGVHRRFYAGFAAFLARQGLWTLTFDYRGIGGSAPAKLKGFEASVHGWGEQDVPGALAYALSQQPGPLFLIGHSVGGQLVGLLPEADARSLTAVVTIAAQSGYWKLWPGAGRAGMWALWHVAIPGLVGALGYMPMKRLGQGEDLPAGVALEWARWGKHPGYVLSYEKSQGFARFDRPLRAYLISDDAYAPRPTVERLFSHFTSAPKELKVITPADAGAKQVGHFGFFRSKFESTLWTDVVAWLDARTPKTQAAG